MVIQPRAPGTTTIMLVEDDHAVAQTLIDALESSSYRVWLAETGADAKILLEQTRPDLIILDLMMPKMDGFEFVEHLRKREGGRDIPVVVLTAKDLTEEDRRRLRGAVDNVLQKGDQSGEVVKEVRRLLQRPRRLVPGTAP